MKKIVVAGATGYLGSHLVRELQNTRADIKALGRNQQKLADLGLEADQLVLSTITDPSTLAGVISRSRYHNFYRLGSPGKKTDSPIWKSITRQI